MQQYLIIIEGNLGSGKSSFLKKMKKNKKNEILYFYEPVKRWRKSGLLKKFYENEIKNFFPLQYYIASTFLDRDIKINNLSNFSKKIIIVERDINSAEEFFLPAIEEEMNQNDILGLKSTLKLYREILKNDKIIKKYVYLKTPAEECFKRINKRARFEEKNISLNYVKKLSNIFNLFFEKNKPWLILDGLKPFSENIKILSNELETLI